MRRRAEVNQLQGVDSRLIWPDEIKRRLRTHCLATKERADKLTDAWAQHPLMGRAYMPSYRYGTDLVLKLVKDHQPSEIIPVLYGARGMIDAVTVQKVLSH